MARRGGPAVLKERHGMDVNGSALSRAAQADAAPATQCERCARFIGGSESGGATGRCQAFDEIPEALWSGQVSHQAPHPGDRGLRFKPWK
jgi:hypothetical protein